MFVLGYKLVDIRLQNCFNEIAEILVSTPENRKTYCIHFLYGYIYLIVRSFQVRPHNSEEKSAKIESRHIHIVRLSYTYRYSFFKVFYFQVVVQTFVHRKDFHGSVLCLHTRKQKNK